MRQGDRFQESGREATPLPAKLAGFKKQGENAAFIAFILFLVLIPLGTVLGIIGLNKLQKARVILE